jgi:DNA-binding transcriptional MerR regulator
MTTSAPERPLRIGEVAELTGTTPRTLRYYEEIGLLPGAAGRAQGEHRCFTRADVDRVKRIVRVRDLLGLSLDELTKVVESEDSLGALIERVRQRCEELRQLERELVGKRRATGKRLRQP